MADLSGYTPIYIRTTGDDSTGDGSLGAPFATAQKGFDTAIATASGNYVLDFGAGDFGGVVLSQDWPARIAVRGVGATSSFLGGISASGSDFNYFWDYSGFEATVYNATSGHNVELHNNGGAGINVGNITTRGGSNAPGGYDWGLYGYGWIAKVGDGGNITLSGVTAGALDARTGSTNTYWDYPAFPGNITLTNVIAGDINASCENYAFLSESIPAGTVLITGSSVGNVTANGAMDGTFAGSGGPVTLTNSTCGVISSNGGSAESVPGWGGNVTLTNSTCGGNISCSGSVDGYDGFTIMGPGGNVTLTNSTCSNINCMGGPGMPGTLGAHGVITITGSTVGEIIVSGATPGQYFGGDLDGTGANGGAVTLTSSSCGNITADGGNGRNGGINGGGNGGSAVITSSACGDISLQAGTGATNGALGTATFAGTAFNANTVTGNAVFNGQSFNIGTVTGVITYNGFTGTNDYGTFRRGGIPRTLYYNAAVDNDWATLGNWWTDDGYTTQATSLPASIDDVISGTTISANSGGVPTVANFTQFDPFAVYAQLQITLNVTGVATFNDNSWNASVINGNAVFIGGAGNEYGTVNGNATFYGGSYNSGTVYGNATFYGWSYNIGPVNGNATFYDSSLNSATITGDVIFNDSAVNINTINGAVIFNDSAYSADNSCIVGDVIVNDTAQLYRGVAYGNAVFNDNSSASTAVSIYGNVVFNDRSSCDATNIFGNAVFNAESFSVGVSINGDVALNDSVIFYPGMYNSYVSGTATFNDSSFFVPPGYFGTLVLGPRTLYPIQRGLGGSDILGMI